MKNVRMILGLILIMTLALVLAPINAKAENYTYRINIIIGGTDDVGASFVEDLESSLTIVSDTAQVNVIGTDCITIDNLQYEDQISFNPKSAVALPAGNAKYYVKGMRLSGANDVISKSAFDVTQDDAYVIAYGVGAVIPYTVKYLDAAGNPLLEDATYYGALGEEVYVPYRFISGYTPNAYNLHTDSLTENQEFVFTYTRNSGSTVYNTNIVTSYGTVDGGTQYSYQSVMRGITPDATGGVIDNRQDQAPQAGDAGNAGGNENAQEQPVNIGDDQVPLAVEDIAVIGDEEVAKAIDENLILDTYKRYALVLLIIGGVILLITGFVTVKDKHDDRKNK